MATCEPCQSKSVGFPIKSLLISEPSPMAPWYVWLTNWVR
jgi:hypothetical protein